MNTEELLKRLRDEAPWLAWEPARSVEGDDTPAAVTSADEKVLRVRHHSETIGQGIFARPVDVYTAETFGDGATSRADTKIEYAIRKAGAQFCPREFATAEELARECAQCLPGEWQAGDGMSARCGNGAVYRERGHWRAVCVASADIAFGSTPAQAIERMTAKLREMCGVFWPRGQ